MVVNKRNITVKGLLGFLDKEFEIFFPLTRKGVYRRVYGSLEYVNLEEFFPSVILRAANNLARQGIVESIKTKDGEAFRITEKGRRQTLKYQLTEMKPKTGPWDGKWRMVFFDIPQTQNNKRNYLRNYLKALGLKQMQESVWVSPYDVSGEVKYLREVLDIPNNVKLAEVSSLENSEELKEIFGV